MTTIQSQLDQVLAPCPFCGCAMRFRKALHVSDGNTDSIIHAEPTNCGLVVFDMGTTDESIVAAWNNSISAIRAAVGGEAEPVYQISVLGGHFMDVSKHRYDIAPNNPELTRRVLYASPPAAVDVGAIRELLNRIRPGSEVAPWVYNELAALIGKEA